ncbi:MAG: metal-sensitive transcriptional regulator [Bacillota bacterium]
MEIELHHSSRTSRENQDLLDRLRKIEGQVRGLQRMIEEGRYCVDILTQVAAVKAGLNKVGLALLESHTRGCVSRAIKQDQGEPAVQELMDVLSKFVK